MAITSVFNTGLQMAREATVAVAPGLSSNAYWFQGGNWFQLDSADTPTVDDTGATIFPTGRAGRRARNTRRPVVGRLWSEGTANLYVSSDVLALLLYGAMGSLSSNQVPSTDFLLLDNEPLNSGADKQLVLTTQPSDGGAILRFVISDASAGGTISVQGIDTEGQGASETISFASAGSFYTRTSYSAIGASSITINGNNAASVTIHGIKYFEHTITFNNASNQTFSLLRFGDPTAGAASIQRLSPGMVFRTFGLQSAAEQEDGLVMGNLDVVGYPTATCAAGSLLAASAQEVWPTWTQTVTRDGTTYSRLRNFSFNVDAGGNIYYAAAGTQGPQGNLVQGTEVTGSFQIFVEDETEWNRWLGASQSDFVMQWDTPHKLTSSENHFLSLSLTQCYMENPTKGEEDETLVMSFDFRMIEDATNGLMKALVRNGVPGIAYGNTVS